MPSSPLQLGAAEVAPPTEKQAAPHVPVVPERWGPVRATLPGHSTEPLRLNDSATGMAIEVQPRDVLDVVAQSADGYYVYPNARTSGGTLLHRALEDGAEDFVSFGDPPAGARGRLRSQARQGVGGLRLVEGTLSC